MRTARKLALLSALTAAGALAFLNGARGPAVFLALGTAVVCPLLFLREAALAVLPVQSRAGRTLARVLGLGVLAAGGCAAGLLLLELGLLAVGAAGRVAGGEGAQAAADLAMPADWEMRDVQVAGASRAFTWQGQLHVFNGEGFRNVGPYEKQEGVMRIAVMGDSVTYGYGISAEDAYPAEMQRLLEKVAPVRVYNLGSPGAGSAELLEMARAHLASIAPDLVVYGLFLDDYLPPVIDPRNEGAVPLPDEAKRPIQEGTSLGELLTKSYDGFLMERGIRENVMEHVYKRLGTYRKRLQRDLVETTQFCRERAGCPPLAMVLQYPEFDPNEPYAKLTSMLEADARAAGMEFVDFEPFRRQFHGKGIHLQVSRWEAHPNSVAHRKFAELFAAAVRKNEKFAAWAKKSGRKS